jgi:hypothetical protein
MGMETSFSMVKAAGALTVKLLRIQGIECPEFFPPPHTRVYPKVSGLAAWSENCKWYNSLPLGAVVSLFFESV